MNYHLILLNKNLSPEILYIIQSYLVNECAYKMLKEYFQYLIYKKNLYQDFCYKQYVSPNCGCYRYYNSNAQRWKSRDCYYCDELEYGNKYLPQDYIECIKYNPQYEKIINYNY